MAFFFYTANINLFLPSWGDDLLNAGDWMMKVPFHLFNVKKDALPLAVHIAI
jgi:hypothetical protein